MKGLVLISAGIVVLVAAPAQAVVILDPAPGVETVGFQHTGGWQQWTVPTGVSRVTVELLGGVADELPSTEWGHLYAEFPTTGGEVFAIYVGGQGGDTTATRGGEPLAVAAGSEGGEANYVSPLSTNSSAWYENEEPGGPVPSDGWARILYRPPVADPLAADSPAADRPRVTACTVPRLRGRAPAAARRAIMRSHCAVGHVTRRPTIAKKQRRVVRQSIRAGTELPVGSEVGFVVGRRS